MVICLRDIIFRDESSSNTKFYTILTFASFLVMTKYTKNSDSPIVINPIRFYGYIFISEHQRFSDISQNALFLNNSIKKIGFFMSMKLSATL